MCVFLKRVPSGLSHNSTTKVCLAFGLFMFQDFTNLSFPMVIHDHHISSIRIFNIYHDASYKTHSTLIIIHFNGDMVLQKVIQIRGKATAETKRTDQD